MKLVTTATTLAFLGFLSLSLPQSARAAENSGGTSMRSLWDQAHQAEPARPLAPNATLGALSTHGITARTALAHEIYGFHPYWENGAEADYRWSALSTLIFFKLEVTFDGYLVTSNPNYAMPTGLVDLAHGNGVRVELSFTSTDVSANNALLTSKTYYTRAADALVAKAVAENADGLNVDIELIDGSNRAALTDFLTTLADKMHAAKPGSTVSADIPAIDWESAWDLPALGTSVDRFIMMGYDYWGCWSDTAGPIAPLYSTSWRTNYSVSDSVTTYLDELDSAGPGKLVLGVPWYGGSWETSSSAVPKSVSPSCSGGGDWLGPLLFTEAEEEAASHTKNWYAPSRVPYTTTAAGQNFQTWYDDAQSLIEKYTYAESQDLAGVAVWALGYENGAPAVWDGLTAYGQGVTDTLARVFGSNRYETANAISLQLYRNEKSADAVVLTTGTNWPDALGGSVLAKKVNGPLLLTDPSNLLASTAAEIDRVLKPGGTVYLLGGTGALSQEVAQDLTGLGFTTTRLSGANRFETAATVANAVAGQPTSLFIGTGANFPDVLSMAAPATLRGEPILLTNRDALPQATLDYLNGSHAKKLETVYLAGGEAAVGRGVADQLTARGLGVVRLEGVDRYATSDKIARHFFAHPEHASLATGQSYADGLAGAVLAAANNAPLLLVQRDILPTSIWDYLEDNAATLTTGHLFGGTAAVSRAVQDVAQTLIAP